MPLTLPGLFDFTRGVDSGIAQQSARANASANEALSFVAQLNAFNTAQNTNDNLEFRRGFAEQPQGTSILDRFSNVAQNTSNPFALNQAVTQQQSLAPLLALGAAQNPQFGAQQGIPSDPNQALQQLLFGANPFFQQQANQGIQQTLATNNPQLSATQVGGQVQSAAMMEIEHAREMLRLDQEAFNQKQQAAKLNQSNNTALTPSTATPQANATAGLGFGSLPLNQTSRVQ